MSTLLSVVAGWTQTLGPFTLKVDGVAVDLTGFTVTLILHKPSGILLIPGGVVTVLNQTTNKGQVTYDPIATDFVFAADPSLGDEQLYAMHWKVVDGSGKIVFFPNVGADEIGVYKP